MPEWLRGQIQDLLAHAAWVRFLLLLGSYFFLVYRFTQTIVKRIMGSGITRLPELPIELVEEITGRPFRDLSAQDLLRYCAASKTTRAVCAQNNSGLIRIKAHQYLAAVLEVSLFNFRPSEGFMRDYSAFQIPTPASQLHFFRGNSPPPPGFASWHEVLAAVVPLVDPGGFPLVAPRFIVSVRLTPDRFLILPSSGPSPNIDLVTLMVQLATGDVMPTLRGDAPEGNPVPEFLSHKNIDLMSHLGTVAGRQLHPQSYVSAGELRRAATIPYAAPMATAVANAGLDTAGWLAYFQWVPSNVTLLTL